MHVHHTGEGNFIHKDRGKREPRKSTFWRGPHGIKRKFIIANLIAIVTLNVVFLANMSNFLGSSYGVPTNVHKMKVLYIDYDGNSPVSQALEATYDRFQGDGFPTLVRTNPADFPTQETIEHEVCKNIDIWGVIYTHQGASERLSAALSGVTPYNSSDAISYVWTSVRYTTWAASEISASLDQLISAANTVYALKNPEGFATANTTSASVRAALVQPFISSSIDLMPTLQGSRVFLNTVLIVMTVISQFFFVMSLNGIASGLGLFTRLSLFRNMYVRLGSALFYSSCLAATITGSIWAFRDGWGVSASQGVETWLLYTMACNIHFFVFDTVASFMPHTYIPMFVITWVLVNVTSTIVPLTLAPAFYRWQYASPSYEIYQLLVTIWSGGCAPQMYRALPILFTWWILGMVGSWLSMIKKCNDATVLEGEADDVDRDVDAEAAAEKQLADAESNSTNEEEVEAMRSNILARKATLQRDVARAEKAPDTLWMSAPVPFQDSLGLTHVRTVPPGFARWSANKKMDV